MCGIAGFYDFADPRQASEVLTAMTATLDHRGPDGRATWLDPEYRVGMGHTRLAIIDLDGGAQPMLSADEQFVVVLNGEIYNYQSLRVELEALGQSFRTKSDTEVFLNAYRQWGKECLSRLSGMFAVAIYDKPRDMLLVARDRTGIKPLYYHAGKSGFFFASELKALLGTRAFSPHLDHRALADFFVLGYPLIPTTFFSECAELRPGTWLEMSRGKRNSGTFWTWQRDEEEWNEETSLKRTEEALVESLAEHLIADVPVGAFLSGGIDSSILVALLAQSLGARLQTFNVKFGETAYDESPFARVVAERFQTQHHEICLNGSSADLNLVGEVLDQFDQPFGDSSAIPTYLICRETRQHVKVVIGGDGGDEMFGGYPRFRYADVAKTLSSTPDWLRGGAAWLSEAFQPVSAERSRQMRRLLRAAQSQSAGRLLALSCFTFPENLDDILLPDVLTRIADYCPSLGDSQNPGGAEFVDATVNFALPGDYLRKVDCMSSAHGLEVRVPFLGSQVLNCAEQIPHRLKYDGKDNKLLLRRLAKRYLPETVVNKPKAGFGIPLDSWLGLNGRQEVRSVLSSTSARLRDFIRPDYLNGMLDSFVSAQWDKAKISRFNLYQQVYFLLGFERWLQRWRPAY